MSLSRKRQKELRKLQKNAGKLWESQRVLVDEAGDVAKQAGRQIGHYNREHIIPAVEDTYERYAAPVVHRVGEGSRHLLNDKFVPAAGAVVGSAMSVWDTANDARAKFQAQRNLDKFDWSQYGKKAEKYKKKAERKLAKRIAENEIARRLHLTEPKKKRSAGSVIAIILGVAAAAGVAYAAWQTLRADDELWVADDPLRAPDA